MTGLVTRSGVTNTSFGGDVADTLTTWIEFWSVDCGDAGCPGGGNGTTGAGCSTRRVVTKTTSSPVADAV